MSMIYILKYEILKVSTVKVFDYKNKNGFFYLVTNIYKTNNFIMWQFKIMFIVLFSKKKKRCHLFKRVLIANYFM